MLTRSIDMVFELMGLVKSQAGPHVRHGMTSEIPPHFDSAIPAFPTCIHDGKRSIHHPSHDSLFLDHTVFERSATRP